jgi:hypothetical protein
MNSTGLPRRTIGALGVIAACLSAAPLEAQAWSYPSFQQPRVTERDFNFAVADAGSAGTSVVFQWREGIAPRTQFSLDVGLADPDGRNSNNFFLLGGQYAYQLSESRADLPLDFLLTAGLYGALGGGANLIRVPFGLSVGHRFPLEEGFAITPYIHPRLSLDLCNECAGGDDSDSELGIDFDVGVTFEITRQLAIRASAVFGGSDIRYRSNDGFGISFSWTPPSLNRR